MTAVVAIAVVLAMASGAWAQDSERFAMSQIRFSTEVSAARGCAHVSSAKDNSLRDLRRKIVRAGGNLAVLSFHVDDMSTIFAEVYRCGVAGGGPPPGPASAPPAATAPPPPVTAPALPQPPPPPPLPPSPPMR